MADNVEQRIEAIRDLIKQAGEKLPGYGEPGFARTYPMAERTLDNAKKLLDLVSGKVNLVDLIYDMAGDAAIRLELAEGSTEKGVTEDRSSAGAEISPNPFAEEKMYRGKPIDLGEGKAGAY